MTDNGETYEIARYISEACEKLITLAHEGGLIELATALATARSVADADSIRTWRAGEL
jgi:hypothetical protein